MGISEKRCEVEGCDRDWSVVAIAPAESGGVTEHNLCDRHISQFISSQLANRPIDDDDVEGEIDNVPCKVALVVFDHNDNTSQMIYLAHTRGILPVSVGVSEASNIYHFLKGTRFVRPPTHAAMAGLIDMFGGSLKAVGIDRVDAEGNCYYASLRIQQASGGLAQFDVRPSDAIALAIWTHKQIFVPRSLLRSLS